MDLQEKIAALTAACSEGKLRNGDLTFAQNLIRGFHKFGNLTDRQLPWVDNLLARAGGTDTRPTAELSNFSGVYALFQRAKAHLKFPKVTLLLPGGKPVKLYMSTARSRVPDTINIVEPQAVGPNNKWYGRVAADGRYTPSREAHAIMDDLTRTLNRLASEPEAVAAEYGKLTGNCCFCSLPLTDERSTAVGYGPVCAEHYGLAWGNKDETPVEVKVAAGVPMQRRIRARRAA